MSVAMLKSGQCECGQLYMILQDAERAETMRGLLQEDWDIYVTGPGMAACSQCGRVRELPPPEILDTDRWPLGRWLAELDEELSGQDSGSHRAF